MKLTRRQTLIAAMGSAAVAMLPLRASAAADEAIAEFTGGATAGEGGITLRRVFFGIERIGEAVEVMDRLGQGRDIDQRRAFGHPVGRHHKDRPRAGQVAAQFRPRTAVFGILNRVHWAAMT